MRVPVALLLGLVLTGCGDPTEITETEAPVVRCTDFANAIPFGEGHDHSNPELHRKSCNATMLAFDDLQRFGADAETVVGAHAMALGGDLLAVGVNAGETADGQQGAHLFDVSIPEQLVHVGFYSSPQPVGGDRTLAFSGDYQALFLGYEGAPRPGVAALDVSDPTNPSEVAFWEDPQGFGSHTIGAGVVGGVQYVFTLSAGVNILRYDETGFTLVGKYAANDQGSAADAPDSSSGASTYALRSFYGHDMTFFQDPIEGGHALLFVAYAYDGLKVLDVTQPSTPVLVGRWMPPSDTDHRHYTHSVAAERGADGKLILVVGSETFEEENQGIASPLWILDASNVAAATQVPTASAPSAPSVAEPMFLSTWRNPSAAPAGNLGLSVHFFRLEQGLLYISHYHGGVWAVDLRDDSARDAATAYGYAMPLPPNAVTPPEECCFGFDLNGAPMVFDVEVRNGVVYSADETQGVAAMKFDLP